MRKLKRPIYLAVLLAGIVLTLSMIACGTTPRVEYIHEIPDVVFPVFPPPDCVTYDDDSDLVSMPLWYWQKIAEYKIDVDAIENYFNQLRELKKKIEQGEIQ